jgi:alcohol dehydrogenase
MACGDHRAAFRAVLLDPELTLTQPAQVTALTGFDAMAHAVETYVTNRQNPISRCFSREAWRHLAANYLPVLHEPEKIETRANMQWGACLAGLAIENSMLGAAHALANPLTANFGIAHGQAVALMLPAVVRYNGHHIDGQYHELLSATPQLANSRTTATDALADFLTMAREEAGLAGTLESCRIPQKQLPELAADAAQQWTGTFNPVPLSVDDFQQLYEHVYC